MINALILCAGKGSRMEPLSDYIPKPLLPIKRKPVLQQLLLNIEGLNPDNIGIVIHEEDEDIFNKFLNNFNHNTHLDTFIQSNRKGIIKAIQSAKKYYESKLVAMAGDTLFSAEQILAIGNSLHKTNSCIVLGARKLDKSEITRRSNIIWNQSTGIVKKSVEKPQLNEIQGNWSGSPIWGFSEDSWELFSKSKPSNNGEYVVEGVVDLAKEREKKVIAVDIGDSIDITYPKDVLVHNFPYIEQLLF